MNRAVRLVGVVLLLAAVLALGVYAGATGDERWPYPEYESIDDEYDQYVGQEMLLFGTVERVGDGSAVLTVEHDRGTFQMAVRNFDATVQPGGVVQVYGTLETDYRIDARRIVVVNPAAGSLLFKYGVSAVAVGLFLMAFFRYWRVDARAVQLEGRDGG